VPRPEAAPECNECNEALETAIDALRQARRLVLVAQDALLNGDLQRASSVLRKLLEEATDPRWAFEAQRGDVKSGV
jgi:hypothetical protein